VKKTFDVYFSGELLENHELEQVKAAVGELFGLSGPKLEALFSGVPVRIKKELSAEKAGRFRKTFLGLGALVRIVPAGEEPDADDGPAGERRKASHPNSSLHLAPMEPLHPKPPASIPERFDTSSLEAAPPRTGSLESYANPPEPAPLPDVSNLSLAPLDEQDGKQARDETRPPLPDVSHLEALPPNSGSLADCVTEKKPVPIPSLDGLSLEE